uniref:Uncharacterized protein n=1 Tax=Romanomermis culicivorax TaxID=13658 RepID=A0A915KHW2_ROMCU
MAASSSALLEQNLINAGQIIHEHVDAEIERLNNLDDKDLERLRQARLEEMKKRNALKQDANKKTAVHR